MKRLCVFLLAFTFPAWAWAQGCSDAGFCTMGAMKPDQPYNKKVAVRLKSAELSFYRGTTTMTPIIYVVTADLNFSYKSKNTFQVKLPYQAVQGRLANTSGAGDISLCFTRNVYASDRFSVNLSFGAKLPTNHSDKVSAQGLPLPMYYQTSLGTYDLISGISLINRRWLFATGIQVPLNHNRNQFVWSDWANTSESDYILGYSQARNLKRGTDVMLRVERNFRFARFNMSAGLLPIYRINRDELVKSGAVANSTLEKVKPDGAKGLACSFIVTAGYNFDVRSGVKLLVGHKLVQRDVNPDGLTRELVTSITYAYRF